MYKPIIGLEIHTELKTASKMFCSCRNDSNEHHPNVNICPICLGHPGTLPVANKQAIRKVIKTGLALHCKILKHSKFDRKNYFYPDLPKGYQISQYDKPFCKDGYLQVAGKNIRIQRIHLEEDTGKLLHPEKADYSLVDFNRAGVPLMELVTDPDLQSAQETRQFAQELQLILRYLEVSDADMEKGQMRVEANISVSKGSKMGTKVEIKNLNSFRAVEKAIEHEIKRQAELLDKGEKVVQETRGWNETMGITISQRKKEESHDYRYFPEPDLPEVQLTQDFIEEIKTEIPELPQQRKDRFIKEYSLEIEQAAVLVVNKDLGEYFEKVISELGAQLSAKKLQEATKTATNYIITDLLGLLKKTDGVGEDFLITPENFAEFIALLYDGTLSSKTAKQVLREMFGTGADPSHIIETKGLTQLTDETEIENAIKAAIEKNTKAVEDYKKGKQNALQFLIGQVMAATNGRADITTVSRLLKDLLER